MLHLHALSYDSIRYRHFVLSKIKLFNIVTNRVRTRFFVVGMDSNAATMHGTTKQLKYGAKDIISQIHDSILGHILSFLPTMEAVQTSVLSTRWIDVWTSITNLKLNDGVLICSGKKMQKEQYEYFVNTMLLHLANLSIQSFSLCLTCFHYESSQVSAWISSILEMGVQRLEIQYESNFSFTFPL